MEEPTGHGHGTSHDHEDHGHEDDAHGEAKPEEELVGV